MEALKWVGYIVAALLVLAVISGVGIFVATVVFLGGFVGLVMGIASFMKGLHKPPTPPRK